MTQSAVPPRTLWVAVSLWGVLGALSQASIGDLGRHATPYCDGIGLWPEDEQVCLSAPSPIPMKRRHYLAPLRDARCTDDNIQGACTAIPPEDLAGGAIAGCRVRHFDSVIDRFTIPTTGCRMTDVVTPDTFDAPAAPPIKPTQEVEK